MGDAPFISICIPAYQRTESLKRLLDSVEIQHFRDFEVVITDDSPGDELRNLVELHPLQPMIRYFKNQVALGSPENWNEGIRKAKANWIKIMHDDDWFSGSESLGFFAAAVGNGNGRFYFSAYTNVFSEAGSKTIQIKNSQLRAIYKNPEILIAVNHIGPPSAVIFKKDDSLLFDNRMRWLVDIDFYIRYLKKFPPAGFISNPLVQIGISESQVTRSSFGNPNVEIPERFILLEKTGTKSLDSIQIYDSWWRFIRNLHIRDTREIEKSGYSGNVPDFIPDIVSSQRKIPHILLRLGLFSKFFMLLQYSKRRFYNKR